MSVPVYLIKYKSTFLFHTECKYFQSCWYEQVSDTFILIEMPQAADKLYHIMLYRVHLAMTGIRTHNKVNLR
jgi:hypothetical protein